MTKRVNFRKKTLYFIVKTLFKKLGIKLVAHYHNTLKVL